MIISEKKGKKRGVHRQRVWEYLIKLGVHRRLLRSDI